MSLFFSTRKRVFTGGASIVHARAHTYAKRIRQNRAVRGRWFSWMSLHIFRIPFFCCATDYREKRRMIDERKHREGTRTVCSQCMTHFVSRPSVRSSVRFVPCILATNMTETREIRSSSFSRRCSSRSFFVSVSFAISRRRFRGRISFVLVTAAVRETDEREEKNTLFDVFLCSRRDWKVRRSKVIPRRVL